MGITCEITGIMGPKSDPKHVILYTHQTDWAAPARAANFKAMEAVAQDSKAAVQKHAIDTMGRDPWRIGQIVRAALVLLHHEHDWTISASHNAIFGY
ncbi:hypothetical protein Nocox_07310 [Nonomuraea coxensis DSM 45129]|uniref:Uncharacterized protein n=1 Tax=Nonomuraea coxensis DSM 45129 TaxID=1122611 RepID=A0ABX8TXA4_9ACTN|nr:hypothetical protein [Nonomuraea coxensis]QYC39087.1 hypothetical protein Nocox_07310 [Nonomuraea coxensis DSM 45129]